MKQLLKTMIFASIALSVVFAANKRILKSEMKMDKLNRVEPDYRKGSPSTRDDCPHQYPNNDKSTLTVIDSSANGFGMVSTVTRPFDVNSYGNMLVVYRQYKEPNTTHGQLGAAYSEAEDGWTPGDPLEWQVQWNVNANGNPPWGGGGVGGGGAWGRVFGQEGEGGNAFVGEVDGVGSGLGVGGGAVEGEGLGGLWVGVIGVGVGEARDDRPTIAVPPA